METIRNRLVNFFVLFLAAGCSILDDLPSLCGGLGSETILATIQVTDGEQSPIPDARLICHLESGGLLGSTNETGIAKLELAGLGTELCGFFPECEIMYVRLDDGRKSRPFWTKEWLDGEDLGSSDINVELLQTNPALSE